jgi:hypothetical protein
VLLRDRQRPRAGPQTRRERKRLQRELRDQDRRSAKLAELRCVDALIADATHFVERGWMQHGWFAYVDSSGVRHIVTGCSPRTARAIAPEQVISACLVGAVVHAAGGPSKAHSQLVQRTIALTWHAAFRGAHEPIRWSPSPVERSAHVLDLVRWNDRPECAAHDVTALLDRARGLARAEADRTRIHQPAG